MVITPGAFLPTLIVACAFLIAGRLVTLWTMGWHVKPPRWARDAKVGISLLGALTLVPAVTMSLVIAVLSMLPAIVLVPFLLSSDRQVAGGAS